MPWYLQPQAVEFSAWRPRAISRALGGRVSLPHAEPNEAITGSNWGLYPLTDTLPSMTDAQIVTDRSISVSGGTATASYTLGSKPLANRKQQMREAVNAKRDERFLLGFTHDFSGVIGPKTLQTREQDRSNWLTADSLYSKQIAAGNGAVVGAEIRCADDEQIVVSFSVAAAAITAMGVHGSAIMKRSWALKDAIEAATTHAALDAIDITSGWP